MKKLLLIFFIGCALCSCSRLRKYKWTHALPEEAAFIVIPAEGTTLKTAISSKLISTLEQFSTPDIRAIAKIDSMAFQSLPLKSIVLYAGTHQKLQALWLVDTPDKFEEKLLAKFTPAYWTSHYIFHGQKILRLHIQNRKIYVSHLNNNLTLISTASRAIEQSILTYKGKQPSINLDKVHPKPASLLVNTSEADNWFARIGLVKYQKAVNNAFEGALPFNLRLTHQDNKAINFQLTGKISLRPEEASQLIKASAYTNNPIVLDQYISSEAAGFAVLRHSPAPFPKSLTDTTRADSTLLQQKTLYQKIASTLDVEFAIEMFAHSGFQSTSEHLFIRKLKNTNQLQNQLNYLSQRKLITKVDSSTYFIQSNVLANLLASKLCTFKNFYAGIVDGAVITAPRKGLVRKVEFDHSQHQTIRYQGYYQQMRSVFPQNPSALLVAGPELKSFLIPLITNQQYVNQLFSQLNYLAVATHIDSTKNQLTINITSFSGNQPQHPFHKNWLYQVNEHSLSGHPVFGNLGGSPSKEVAFATKNGDVVVLASDGTLIRRFSTDQDTPVGSPVIYDWFGTGNNVVLLAAGNKIYGWNMNGDILPEFPLSLKYNITSPLVVKDINHDQTPDVIVATGNRELHIINSHGKPLTGWPVKTNVPIQNMPYIGYMEGQPAIVAFSGNTINAWNIHGQSMAGFPLFANAKLVGRPVKFKEAILGNATDGHLYAAGAEIPFVDSLSSFNPSNSNQSRIASLAVSNRALTGTPDISNNKILTTSRSGTIYLYDGQGNLLQTKNTGIPLSVNWSPETIDIDGDGHTDIIALSQNGRLYGWRTGNGAQLSNLPKTNISDIHIGDLQGDGLQEIVGLTAKGLECWTIYPH